MLLFIPPSCVLPLTCICLKDGESAVEVDIPSSTHPQASLLLLLLLLAALPDLNPAFAFCFSCSLPLRLFVAGVHVCRRCLLI